MLKFEKTELGKIDENVFNEAINGLNDDQKALTNAYKETIVLPETQK